MSADVVAEVQSEYRQLSASEKRVVTSSWERFQEWVEEIIRGVISSAIWDILRRTFFG